METLLLQTKLYIPLPRPELVNRAHLLQRLTDGLPRKLTLIAAPAGAGKSTLLAQWLHSVQQGPTTNRYQVAWLSLDETDNDPVLFVRYLIAALQTAHPDLGRDLLPLLAAPQGPSLETIFSTLINQLADCPTGLVLALDDYHHLTDPDINRAINFLLDHQPPTLHIALTTRADPPLSIFRLRARGQLTELRHRDLRFSATETTQLLAEAGQSGLPAADIEALTARTDGWVTGLQLAALSLQGQSDPSRFVAEFTGSHQYVLDYLTGEVLDRQPPAVQQFLQQTSVLSRLTPALCDAVCQGEAGYSAAVLRQLLEQNLFVIPLDDQRRWVRYHHLFADLLQNRLRRHTSPAEIDGLHHRAAAWFRANDLPAEALLHALNGRAFETAAALLTELAPTLISAGRIDHLLRQIDHLPPAVRESNPALELYHGWALFLNGQRDRAVSILAQTTTDQPGLQARLQAALATVATDQADPAVVINLAQSALDTLPDDEPVWRARAWRALGTAYGLTGDTGRMIAYCRQAQEWALQAGSLFLAADIMSQIASAQFHQGRLRQAFHSYQEIINLPETPANFAPAGVAWAGLAEISLEWNDLSAAQTQIERSLTLCRQGGIGHNLLTVYGVQAVISQAMGDQGGADTALQQAERLFHQGGGSLFAALRLVIYSSRVHLLRGNIENARRILSGETLGPPVSFADLPPVLREVHQVWLGWVRLHGCQPQSVIEIFDAVCQAAKDGGRLARVIELTLLRALALAQLGDESGALAALTETLTVAAPAGYTRLFIEGAAAEPALISLLTDAHQQGITPDTTRRLLATLSPGSRVSPPPSLLIHDSLTGRELDVLRLVDAGQTNHQIAATLVVSLNTVKKHTNHIYSKLGVKNRTQAIRKARELNLL
jgi:LuxR family maltose regulon positive regulatory protein